MNSLLPDNKSWINRILQKNMCKLLLQAAILAIHLPFTCDMPAGFTIKCTTCEGNSCGWNGFNSSDEKVINNEQFVCLLHKATGQYSCSVDNNNDDEDPFCNSSIQCGFQDGFQNGKCIITRTPGPGGASRDDTNEHQPQKDKDSVTNCTHDCRCCIECINICTTVGVLALLAVIGNIIFCCMLRTWCPGGQNSRAQSDAQPIRTMATISEQEGHGTELGAEPGEEMGEEVGEGGVIALKLDGGESRSRSCSVTLPPPSEPSDLSSSQYSTLTLDEPQQELVVKATKVKKKRKRGRQEPNGGEDVPLRRRSPHSTDDCTPEPGN